MAQTWRDWREISDLRSLDNIRKMDSHAIQSQYAASRRILALGTSMRLGIDPHLDIDLIYDNWFNIITAKGVGLDNLGVILQIGRTINGPYMGDCFGFDGQKTDAFNLLPFIPDDGHGDHVTITLDDETFRLLLLYKALANISHADAASMNRLLQGLCDSGVGSMPKAAYVLEIRPMQIRWVFEERLDKMQLAIFRAAGMYGRGAGVAWEIYGVNPQTTFGFNGSNMQPFNQGSFHPDYSPFSSEVLIYG